MHFCDFSFALYAVFSCFASEKLILFVFFPHSFASKRIIIRFFLLSQILCLDFTAVIRVTSNLCQVLNINTTSSQMFISNINLNRKLRNGFRMLASSKVSLQSECCSKSSVFVFFCNCARCWNCPWKLLFRKTTYCLNFKLKNISKWFGLWHILGWDVKKWDIK